MFFVKDVHILFKKGALPSKTNAWIRKENFLISLNRIYIWIRNQTLSQEGRNFRLRKVKGCSQFRLLGVVFKLFTSGLPHVVHCLPLGLLHSGREIIGSDKQGILAWKFLFQTNNFWLGQTDFKNLWKFTSSLIHLPCHKVSNLIRNNIVTLCDLIFKW